MPRNEKRSSALRGGPALSTTSPSGAFRGLCFRCILNTAAANTVPRRRAAGVRRSPAGSPPGLLVVRRGRLVCRRVRGFVEDRRHGGRLGRSQIRRGARREWFGGAAPRIARRGPGALEAAAALTLAYLSTPVARSASTARRGKASNRMVNYYTMLDVRNVGRRLPEGRRGHNLHRRRRRWG